MIITSLTGGLGNQLFQYASGRALAYKYGTQLKLDIDGLNRCPQRSYSLDNFNIVAEGATIRDILSLDATEGLLRIMRSINSRAHSFFTIAAEKTGRHRFVTRYYAYEPGTPLPPLLVKRVASQRLFDFDEDFFKLPDNIVLIGTWISYKYFDHIKHLLIHELTVKHELSCRNSEMARKICNTQSVSVHVRRTDKVGNSQHYPTELKYIQQAMSYFNENIHNPAFYIFSDDIEWCKVNIKMNDAVFVDWNDDATAYEDLRLMSLCKHNIIAESSFSWWGAFLNTNQGKIVITPPASRWVNRKNSLCTDILPPEWKVFE